MDCNDNEDGNVSGPGDALLFGIHWVDLSKEKYLHSFYLLAEHQKQSNSFLADHQNLTNSFIWNRNKSVDSKTYLLYPKQSKTNLDGIKTDLFYPKQLKLVWDGIKTNLFIPRKFYIYPLASMIFLNGEIMF